MMRSDQQGAPYLTSIFNDEVRPQGAPYLTNIFNDELFGLNILFGK